MIKGTERSHFTVCFSINETWLRLALEKITSKGETVDLKVVVKATEAEYKVVSNVENELSFITGCGDLSG